MSSTSQGYNFDLVCERKNFKADALPLNPSVKNGLEGKTNHRFPTISNNEKILKTQLPFDYSSLDSAEVSTIKQHIVGLALALFDCQQQWVEMPQIKQR